MAACDPKLSFPFNAAAPRRGGLRAILAASVLLPFSPLAALGQDAAATGASAAPAASAPATPAPAGANAKLKPITPASTPQDAVKVLMERANYWRARYQPAQAVDALNRVLQIDPRNADALADLANIQADRGNMSAAQNALARLRATSPGDPRIATIDQTLRVGPINQSGLQRARTLASEGRPNDAVSQYQRVFKGDQPTPGLSTEYYSVMSGTDAGYDSAKKGLAHQLIANPRDLQAQVAYAKLLTYRENSRAEGITRLNQLAANPATSADANAALRQALLWLPANKSSVSQLQTYLQRHQDDPEIAQHLEAARNPPNAGGGGDPAGSLRVAGFSDLNHGRLDKAASRFEAALRDNGRDADATGGLGLVRLRQGRTAEGRRLLDRAIELNPGKRRQWQAALAGASSGGGQAVGRQWDEVRALAARGDYLAAEARLRPLLGSNQSNTGGLLLLADIQQRAGQLAEAESTYRTVLNRQSGNSAAVIGLAGVLSREGRGAEADQLFARAESMGARGVGQARAQELRQRAEEVTDPVAQAGLYRAAIAIDPANPWLKLELARSLLKQRRVAEARAVMAGVGEGPRPTTDQLRAALLFANETNDTATAQALVARIPARDRTPELQAAIATAHIRADVASAAQLYYVNRPLARERLLALAATPDQDGAHGAEVARAFLSMNDVMGAREAIATAMSVNRDLTPAARVAYSGVLLSAGQTDAAAAVAGNAIPARGVAPAQREALSQVQNGIAVKASDQLNQAGRTADAYDRLAPALAQQPTNPDLNMALGRLYATNNQPGQALAIDEALLRQNPDNFAARRAAVNAAIQAGEYDRAQRMVQDGLQLAPNEPQAWIMSAELAKARGNTGRALHDYQVARDLRSRQMGDPDLAAAPTTASMPSAANTGASFGRPAVPNILNAYPPAAPGVAVPYGAPTSLDPLRRDGRTSENIRPRRQNDAVAMLGADGDDGEQLRQAAAALRHVELAQATLPYYAARAPELSNAGQPQADAPGPGAPGFSPSAAVSGYGTGAGGNAPVYAGGYPSYPAAAYPATAYPAPAPYPATPYPAANAYPAAPYAGGASSAPSYPTGPAYDNPFRGDATGGMTVTGAPNGQFGVPAYGAPAAPADPLAHDIDSNIQALRQEVAPKVEGGFGFRIRSGEQGLSQLSEEFVPLQATYSPGVGQLKLNVTPTFLQAGSVGLNAQQRFGSLPLYLRGAAPRPGAQDANGVGLDVGYGWRWVSADIGTTPVGFREQNIIGGVELAPRLTQDVTLRITGERRAVTDSVLSYAGTVDPRTGETWGGVTRTRGHAQLEYGGSDGLNLYGGGGYAGLDGDHVASNQEWEAGLGGSYPVYRGTDDELRLGLDLVYFGYEKNLYFFTLGAGGYFSPQSYFAALVPITYRQHVGPLNWSIGASLGIQNFHANGSPLFPGNEQGLQTQLNTLLAQPGNAGQIASAYGGQNDTDFAGGLQGDVEYQLTPSVAIGARAGVQHTGNFTEGGGLAYARYTFGMQ